MPATRVTQQVNNKTTTHMVDMKGIAGAIFWCLVVGALTYVVGFSTPGWHILGGVNTGVWESCVCSSIGNQDWQKAVQAMTTIGLIGLIVSLVFIAIYMFIHSVSKNMVVILLTIFIFASVLFMLIGIIIFGTKMGDFPGSLNWSFAFAIIGMIFVAVAGVLSIVQMSKSGVCG